MTDKTNITESDLERAKLARARRLQRTAELEATLGAANGKARYKVVEGRKPLIEQRRGKR